MNDRLPPPLLTITSFYITGMDRRRPYAPFYNFIFTRNRGTRAAVQYAAQFIKYVLRSTTVDVLLWTLLLLRIDRNLARLRLR